MVRECVFKRLFIYWSKEDEPQRTRSTEDCRRRYSDRKYNFKIMNAQRFELAGDLGRASRQDPNSLAHKLMIIPTLQLGLGGSLMRHYQDVRKNTDP